MKARLTAGSILWVLFVLGAPLAVAGQKASAPEAYRTEARRVLRLAAAPFDSAAPGPPARYGLLAQIAEAQARAGDLTGARQTAGGLRNSHEKAEALAGVACELARTGHLTEAIELAEQIASLSGPHDEGAAGKPDGRPGLKDAKILAHYVEVMGSVVLAQALSGDLEKAHQTLALLEDPEYRCAALFGIVVARLAAQDAAGAKQLLENSEDFRKSFVGANDIERSLIDPATALAFILQENRLRPLTADFRRILKLCRWMYTLHEVEHFGYLCGMLAKAGYQSRVDDILAAGSKDKTATPDFVQSFVAGLLWAGDLKNAQRVAEIFPGAENQSRARRLVAEAMAREGDFAGALQVAEPIKSRPVQAVTLATVTALQMKEGGGGATAERALQRAVALTNATNDVRFRFSALCRIARAQAAAGDRTAADKSLEQAEVEALKPVEGLGWSHFVGDLVRTHLEVGDPAAALRLTAAPRTLKLLPHERTPLLVEIADALAGAGKRDEADRVFGEALEFAAREDLLWSACDITQVWSRGGGATAAATASEKLASPVQRSLALLGTAKGLIHLIDPAFYYEDPLPWPLQAGSSSLRERRGRTSPTERNARFR